jgi:hypothetical protein
MAIPQHRFPQGWLIWALFVSSTAAAQSSFDCVAPPAPSVSNPVVLGNGSAGSVTTAQLQTALSAGGAVRLNIGSSTLALSAELVISRDTTLDVNGATLSGGGSQRVIRVSNPNNLIYTFNLLNATIANGSTSVDSGGGLWKPSPGEAWQVVSIRIYNSHFLNNTAITTAQDGGGGAIYVIGAKELTIVGSSFDNNHGANGGAVYSLGSKLVNFFDSSLTGNGATGTGGNPGNGGNAGAIGVDGADRYVNLCRTRLINNTSNAYGAGLFTTVYDQTSFTRILDSTIQGNNSTGTSNAHTGGVYLQGGPMSIRGSTFRDNQAAGYGGLSLFDHQTGTGLVLTSGDITNCTFSGNIARTGLGGAMNLQASGSLLLQNLTIANNSAPCAVCFDGGISNSPGLAITMRNTIFLNNTGGNLFNPWALQNPVSGSNNIQWPMQRPGGQMEAPVSPGATFANTQLLAIANNGGLTETFALPIGSAAIDTGTPTGALLNDQRGMPRNATVDVGAYELQPDLIFRNGFE